MGQVHRFSSAPASSMAIAALVLLTTLLGLFPPAPAALSGSTNLTVTKTADTNDGVCNATDCSLREAIVRSNASPTDEILVPGGTYKLTIPGVEEEFSATGDLDIRAGVTIRPENVGDKVIIDGNGIDRVVNLPVHAPVNPYTVNIRGVRITGGNITTNSGGGISHLAAGSTLNLTDVTVSGNRAVQGGGIQNGYTAGTGETMTINRSTISGNRAPGSQGGGIINGEHLTITNSTISGNRSGHGASVMDIGETLRITDSTIAFNTGTQPGAGLNSDGDPVLKNTIVSNNRADGFAPLKNCNTAVVSEGNNLEKGTSCGFTQSGDLNAGPKLGPLEKNGGPTKTHALLRRSPAIDAGGPPFPDTDQRGVARPQRTTNDIGAYERK